MTIPENWRAEAFNPATNSSNRIHADDVAKEYGFKGGLVPGVTVSGYLFHPAVLAWGEDWLTRGHGKVVVHKDAQKTDARQSNANLLMSDDAEIDTKPELEIYADDVKCSHGATVGQLDENMLFYLRSRAIDADTARSLLTFAFADEVIRRISFAPIRERLEHKVVGRLPDATLIAEFI